MTDETLGPLPPYIYGSECGELERVWTERDMRTYAAAQVAAERERCAKLCEAQATKWGQMRPLDGSMEAALKDAAAAIRANT
jgi:hypothetical protein